MLSEHYDDRVECGFGRDRGGGLMKEDEEFTKLIEF
jgi:hypothetical protein